METLVKNYDTLKSIIDEISMKNTSLDFRWKFVIQECSDENHQGWFIYVAFERPDTETNQIGIGRSRKEYVAKGTTESGVVKTCWLLIELTIRHELMEGFRYKNVRIFNPHNSVEKLMSIQS